MFGDSEDESDASEAEAAPAPAPPAAKKPKPSPPTSGLPSAAALLADSSRPAYVEVAAPPEDVTVAAPIAKPNSQSSNTAGLEQAAEERRFRDTHEALKKEGKARQAKRRRERPASARFFRSRRVLRGVAGTGRAAAAAATRIFRGVESGRSQVSRQEHDRSAS